MGARVDYDQGYGFFATPRAAVVLTPGYGVFAKLLYGRAFKAPSFLDLSYYRKNATYGNPDLKPESVNTFELQVGWFNKRWLAVSANGYLSYFTDLIAYVEKDNTKDTFQGANQFPQGQTPEGPITYEQKENVANLLNYGGELEVRLFPIKGLNIRLGLGVFLGQEIGDRKLPNESALDFAARWSGNLSVSYRYNFVQISGGLLIVGPKSLPKKPFGVTGLLSPDGVGEGSTKTGCTEADKQQGSFNCFVPNWDANNDPTTEAPLYVQSYITIQFLRILGHLDLVLRLSNIANADIYDAGDTLLVPQKRLDFNVWVRLHY